MLSRKPAQAQVVQDEQVRAKVNRVRFEHTKLPNASKNRHI